MIGFLRRPAIVLLSCLTIGMAMATPASATIDWTIAPPSPGNCIPDDPLAGMDVWNCILENAEDDVQGWLIFENNTPSVVKAVEGHIALYDNNDNVLERAHCKPTNFAPGVRCGCPTPTELKPPCNSPAHVYATLYWLGDFHSMPRASRHINC
jgi:hypothetical protein